jgi:RNA recognition motif-containing protein
MNLYVGNLSADTTAADLRALFRPFGPVTWADVWPGAGPPPGAWVGGVGLVSGGPEAIATLHGTAYRERVLAVHEVGRSEHETDPAWE